MIIFQSLIGVLIATGLYMILADGFRIPYMKTSKATANLSKRQKKKINSVDVWLSDIASKIALRIKLNKYKREQLASDLQSAEMDITPEQHTANSLVKSLLVGVFAIPIVFIFPLLFPIIVAIAVAIYFREYKSVSEKIKEKRQSIEYELPRLVFTIEKTLKHSRDVLSILETYKKNAGLEMKNQLNITVADMRSGNYEAASTRLETRVGSTMMSDVTRGLIGVMRGDDTTVYWSTLSAKFADIQRTQLKSQAMKVPGKMKRLSMCMLFCFMAMYIVVIGMEIMTSLGAIFG